MDADNINEFVSDVFMKISINAYIITAIDKTYETNHKGISSKRDFQFLDLKFKNIFFKFSNSLGENISVKYVKIITNIIGVINLRLIAVSTLKPPE
jgi:hypothetical protein